MVFTNERIELTYEGKQKLELERDYLRSVRRVELREEVKLLDLTNCREIVTSNETTLFEDNRRNECRISDLDFILRGAHIFDNSKLVDISFIKCGHVIKLYDNMYEEELSIRLTSAIEADPLNGLISVLSPLGKSLLGKKINDLIFVELKGRDNIDMKIIGITLGGDVNDLCDKPMQ